MIDQKIIDLVNEKTPIVDLASEFVSLSKRGKNYMGLCPFHDEKTPSFSVSPEKNIAMCMGCHEGGNPINFYRKIKNIPFEQAVEELATRAGIEIKKKAVKKDPYEVYYRLMNEVASFYQFNLKSSQKGMDALKYLYGRQMTDPLIQHFRIGYAPPYGQTLYLFLKDKGFNVSDMIKMGVVKQSDDGNYYDLFSDRITFPITNPKGEVVGLSGRTLNPKDPVKYINSPETEIFKKGQLLYHLFEGMQDIRKSKEVVLYEGFFDVISSYAAGTKNGVATMGTALTMDQAKLIKSVAPTVVIAYDGDKAGLSAADHAIPVLEKAQLKVEVLTIPEQMDPDDFINSYGYETYDMLFMEHKKDPYLFRYDYYKMGKDFQNANDIKQFKTQVMQMIQNADASIKAMYVQKLSKALNIPESELTMKRVAQPPREVMPPLPKLEKLKLLSKHENAERHLIFAMLKSSEVTSKAMQNLKSTDFAHVITAAIRLKIEDYYQENDTLILEEFLDTLTTEQRTYMLEKAFKDPLWVKQVHFVEKEVDLYISLVKEANLKRRHNYLCDLIDKEEKVLDQWVKERDQIKKTLMNKN